MIVPFVSLPGRYAKALFEIGKEKNILNELSDDFRKFANFLFQNKKVFSRYAKRNNIKGICKVVGDTLRLNNIFVSFVNVLIENSRLYLINNVANIFNKAVLKERKERDVTVSGPSDFDNEQKYEIEKTVQKLFSEKVNIEYEIDTNILTGLVIKTDGIMIDTSGKGIVHQLDKYLKSTEIL